MANLTHTNVTITQKNVYAYNILKGFHLYNETASPTNKVRFPIREDGTCVVSSEVGFTKLSEHPAQSNVHNYAETQIDFTNGGVNTDIPIVLNSWHPDNLSGLEGTQQFYNIDENKNTKNHLVYSQELTGECLEKTKKYTKWK